ncbi:MAG: hypothetical protein ACRDHH_04445 [Actinomycetota bacterium]
MGPRIRLRTRLWLGGLAAGGLAIAHLFAFALAAPDPLRREELLDATGHGAWPLVISLAMGALVAALAGFAVTRIREPRTTLRILYRGTLARLLVLQVVGFLLLEALERLARHNPVELFGVLGEPVVLIGLVAAAVTAAVGAALIVLFAGLLDRLITLLRALPRAPRALAPAGLADIAPPRIRTVMGSVSLRGPPLPIR